MSTVPPRPPKTPQPYPYDHPPSYSPSSGGPPPVPPPPQEFLRRAAEEQKRDTHYSGGRGGGMLAPQPRKAYNVSESVSGNVGGFGFAEGWEDRRAVSAQGYNNPPPQILQPPQSSGAYGFQPPFASVSGVGGQPPNLPQQTVPGFNFTVQSNDPPSPTSPPVFPNPSYQHRLSDSAVNLNGSTSASTIANRPPRGASMVDNSSSTPSSSSLPPSRPYSASSTTSSTNTSSTRPFSPPNAPTSAASSLYQSMTGLSLSSTTEPGVQLNLTEKKEGEIAIALPSSEDLGKMRDEASKGSGGKSENELKVEWAREVLKFIERTQAQAAATGEQTRITDPLLVRWTDEALHHILLCSTPSATIPAPIPLALYLRGELSATGSFPSYKQKDPKSAFRDFEAAANGGYARAWFKIGREYENFGDFGRAVMSFENGAKKGDCGCVYRLGMAYLLGQLKLPTDPNRAVRLLRQAADTSDLDFPQPAYIYGMLLAGEFEHVSIPQSVLKLDLDLARKYIEKAAYFRYPAAEYKMGFSAEYALLGVQFDPLLSVQYYSLASQQGEVEADMALSKWFLCGAEGCFPVNEDLAFTFAEKAGRKGLPSAEFAVGYYHEVGIGTAKDLAQAKTWYQKASEHDNDDAKQRLKALDEQGVQAEMTRKEHQLQIDEKLIRKRTQAAVRSKDQDARFGRQTVAPPPTIADVPPPQSTSPPLQLPGSTPPSNRQSSGSTSSTGGRLGLDLSPNSSSSRPPQPVTGSSRPNVLKRGDTLKQVERLANQAKNNRNSGGPGAFQSPPHASTLPPQQQQGPPVGRGRGRVQQPQQNSLPPRNPTPQGRGQSQSQSQNQPNRYQLSDGSGGGRGGGGGGPPSSVPAKPQPKGEAYATFAEMGIQTGTAKKNDCVIM